MLILAQKILTPRMRARVSNPSEMGQHQKTMTLPKRARVRNPGGLNLVQKTMTLPKRARVRNPGGLNLVQKTMIHHHRSAPKLALSSAHCGICLQGSFIVLEEDTTLFVLPMLLVLLPQSTLLVDDAPQ